jgi:hypothetical protein
VDRPGWNAQKIEGAAKKDVPEQIGVTAAPQSDVQRLRQPRWSNRDWPADEPAAIRRCCQTPT